MARPADCVDPDQIGYTTVFTDGTLHGPQDGRENMRLAMDESAEDPQLKSVEIVCGHCGHRIPSTVRFGGLLQFDTSTLIGTLRNCPACRKWTVCDKENMVVIYTDGQEVVGGFVGSGTGEA